MQIPIKYVMKGLRQMKKFLVLASVLLVLTMVFAACTGENETQETTNGTAAVTDAGTGDDPAVPADSEEPTAAPETDAEQPTATPEDPTDGEVTDPEAPTDDPEVPTEPPVDPDAPVLMIEADAIASAAATGNLVSASEVTTEGDRTFVRLTTTGGDPYFRVVTGAGVMPQYLVISYRTDCGLDGQFFIGSGAGESGTGDAFTVNWNENADWNLMVIDLTAVGISSIEGGNINYLRMDFFTAGAAENYFDVEYIAFFNTSEAAEDYYYEKHPPYVDVVTAGMTNASFDTFYVNGVMYFEQDGGAGDKLAAQNNTVSFNPDQAHDNMMLRGWIGFGQPIDSFGYYIDNYNMTFSTDFVKPAEDGVKAAGGEHASRFEITVPLSDLTGGAHTVGFVVKLADGTVALLRDELTIVIVPQLDIEEIILAERAGGGPFCGAADKRFGQRYNIGDKILTTIKISDMATYSDGNTNTWSFKVWQWNTDYSTTVAATPLFVAEGENHTDNTTFTMDIPAALFITGDIYYEIEYLTGSAGFTGWKAEGNVVEGIETYVAGNLVEGTYASSIRVGTEMTAPPEEIPEHQLQNPPVYIIKAKDMVLANANQVSMEKMNGYNHFIPAGGDPNFMLFQGQTGSRYAVIKYRTEYIANIQIFLASTGAGPTDDTVMMEMAMIPDGEWHLAIFDTNVLVERGVYDGSTAAYLRLDVMESGYECDENGEPIRDPDGTWHKLPLPEGATVDIAYFAFFDTEEKINGFEYGGDDSDTPDVPAPVEPLKVDLTSVGITGSYPSVDVPTNGAALGLTANDHVISLHYGSINLGEMDLSKYSKVTVTYATPTDTLAPGMTNEYNATAKRVLLLNTASGIQDGTAFEYLPADGAIIATAAYEMSATNAAISTVEIDLSEIDYNGQVYLSFDFRNANNEFGAIAYLIWITGVTFS